MNHFFENNFKASEILTTIILTIDFYVIVCFLNNCVASTESSYEFSYFNNFL